MTTAIIPSIGQGCLYTQQGPGATPGYSALDDRRQAGGSLQAGVYGTSTAITAGGVAGVTSADFMVTQRNAGANPSVDINMPAGGFAWVQGSTINGQGLYGVPVHSVNINEVIAPADATNPRIDQVILEIQDNVLDASSGNQARTRVLTGTPTPGTTLNGRAGAQVLPGNALLLADILVPNGSASVPNGNIRDRRKWARGAQVAIDGNGAADYITATSNFVNPSAQFDRRIECSGAPLHVELVAETQNDTVGASTLLAILLNGSEVSRAYIQAVAVNAPAQSIVGRTFVPAPGSFVFTVGLAVTSGNGTLKNSGAIVPRLSYREIVSQNTANNVVTSG